MNNRRFLSRSEASQYLIDRGLPVARQTLAKYAVSGEGPAYRSFGARVMYEAADLDAWIDGRLTKLRRSSSAVVSE